MSASTTPTVPPVQCERGSEVRREGTLADSTFPAHNRDGVFDRGKPFLDSVHLCRDLSDNIGAGIVWEFLVTFH